jgi:hypothetical protein
MRSGIILTAVSILMVVGIAHAGGSGIFDNGSISGALMSSVLVGTAKEYSYRLTPTRTAQFKGWSVSGF